MQELVRARCGRCSELAPHHNVDAYRRSDFLAALEAFRDKQAPTESHRFRSRDDWQRSLVLYYALARGEASLREVTRYNKLETPCSGFAPSSASAAGATRAAFPPIRRIWIR